MPIRVQSLRSSVKGARPVAGAREVGEIFANFADLQFGIIDAAKNPVDLVAVRFFSASADYSIGNFVIQAGTLYRAKSAVTAAAFNATQWDAIPTAVDLALKENSITPGTTSQYWRGDKSFQTLDKAAVGLSAVDNTSDVAKPVSTAQATADNLRVLKAGDTMTGTLALSGAGSLASGQLNVAPSVAGGAVIQLRKGAGTFPNNLFGMVGAVPRWVLQLGDSTAESGGNTGSHLNVFRYDDGGTAIDAPFNISRTTGKATFSVVPTIPAPSAGTDAANKTYVDAQVATKIGDAPSDSFTYGRKNGAWSTVVGGAVISDTAPAGPLQAGQLWWESDTGNTFIWYNDGNTSQWVQQNVSSQVMPAFKGARVKLNADKALVTATVTPVIWDAIIEDVGGWWAAGAPTLLTVPAGVTRVRCLAQGCFTSNATGMRQVLIYKNGVALAPAVANIAANTGNVVATQADTGWLSVVAGDTFAVQMYQNSTISLNAIATTSWFAIEAYPGQ